MRNPQKGGGSFSLDEREEMIQKSVGHLGNVSITMFSSLVVDLAKEIEADFIIKGLRAVSDFENELQDGTDEQRRLWVHTLFIPSASKSSFSRRSSFERSPSSVAMCRRWCRRRSTVASRNVSGEWGSRGAVPRSTARRRLRRCSVRHRTDRAGAADTAVGLIHDQRRGARRVAGSGTGTPRGLRAARLAAEGTAGLHRRVQAEGDQIIATSRSQAEQMVQRTELVKMAEERAVRSSRTPRNRPDT